MVWDVRFYLSTSCRISSHKDWDQSKNGRERWRNTSLLWSCSDPIRSSKMQKKVGWMVGSQGECGNYTKQIQPPIFAHLVWAGGERNWQLMSLVFLGCLMVIPKSRWGLPESVPHLLTWNLMNLEVCVLNFLTKFHDLKSIPDFAPGCPDLCVKT